MILYSFLFFQFLISFLKAHPFYDNLCESFLSEIAAYGNSLDVKYNCFFPIIKAEEAKKVEIIESIKNLFDHSHGVHNPSQSSFKNSVKLKNIVLYNDNLSTKPSTWSNWAYFSEIELGMLKILSSDTKLGSIKGKNFAVNFIKTQLFSTECHEENSFLLFLDEPALLSEYYAYPLSLSLSKNERDSKVGTISYPSIDVLYPKSNIFNIIKGNRLVSGFTWDFTPRWEEINSRIGKLNNNDNEIEILSPSIPPVFAMTFTHYDALGGFDENLHPSPYHHENIDTAIRTWTCGGTIVRHSCSRASMKFNFFPFNHINTSDLYYHFPQEKSILSQFQQKDIDANINLLSNRYFHFSIPSRYVDNLPHFLIDKIDDSSSKKAKSGLTFTEFSFYQRFSNDRIPYRINSPHDFMKDRPPQSAYGFAGKFHPRGNEKLLFCTTLEWYLDSIYPGLLNELGSVATDYHHNFLKTDLYLKDFINFHYSSTPPNIVSSLDYKSFVEAIQPFSPNILNTQNIPFIPNKFVVPKDISFNKFSDHITHHQQLVSSRRICKDLNSNVNPSYCEDITKNGDIKACEKNKPQILLVCPDSCNWCDENNEFCEDLYIQKCPNLAAQGKCDTEDQTLGLVKNSCRKSCNICTQRKFKPKSQEIIDNKEDFLSSNSIESRSNAKPADFESIINQSVYSPIDILNKALLFAPDILHKRYIDGNLDQLPEAYSKDLCSIKNTNHRSVLNKIVVNKDYSYKITPNNDVKIFCAIYTYHKNHESVKAVYSTWGKKCDGFMAFSDKEDPINFAHPINHKGKEDYDNMWQKSKSIWQFIYNKFATSYDYFLIGGDDMFYIIENLRAYLNSNEIVHAQNKSNGLFLGNRFYPSGLKPEANSNEPFVFNSGGAGYILDQKSLEKLGKDINNESCFPNKTTFSEDVQVALCLKNHNILPYDTRDKNKEERFHPFTPELHLSYRYSPNDWYTKYKPDLKYGLECCSSESHSFHYVKGDLMYKIYNYLYNCDNK